MSKLADALNEKRRPVKPSIDQWLQTLDEEDLKEITAAARDEEISTNGLYEVLRDSGVAIAKERVMAWRESYGFTR